MLGIRTTIKRLARVALPTMSAARAQKAAVNMKKQNIKLKKMVTKTTLVRREQMRKTKVKTPINNNQKPGRSHTLAKPSVPLIISDPTYRNSR